MGGATLTGPAGTARIVARSTTRLLTKRRAHWWWSVLSLSFLAGVVVGASSQGYTLRWNVTPARSPARAEQAVTWTPGALRRGNLIYLTQPHRQVAAFRVYSVTPHGKAAALGRAVYGYTGRPPLRLVTCEGTFDRRTSHCLGHVAVAARLQERPRGGLPDARRSGARR
jgi:hypothetical protein